MGILKNKFLQDATSFERKTQLALLILGAPAMTTFIGQTFTMNQIINLKEVIQITGLSRATIYNIMSEKHKQYDPTFPKQVNLTVGRVGWSALEINQWIESKLANR